MTNWRQSPEYKAAVEVAFAPYQACIYYKNPEIPDEYYVCAFCGEVMERKHLHPCHVFKVKPYPMLKMYWGNILPGGPACHRAFDIKPPEVKKAILEDILPGRWAELEAMTLERSCLVN